MSASAAPARAPELRRLWGESLAGVNLFAEAVQVWPAEDTRDQVRRAELALLAGSPRAALGLLDQLPMLRSDSPEQQCADVLAACGRALTGDDEAFGEFLTSALALHPSTALTRLVALAAAGVGRLPIASAAAWHALRDGCGDHRLLVIAAAGAAAEQRYPDAIVLSEEAEACRLPARQDAAATVVNLLRHSGHEAEALGLAAVGAQAWTLPAGRRRVWAALVPPRSRRVRRQDRTGVVGVASGLDGPATELIRAHRSQRLRRLPVSAMDVATPVLAGWFSWVTFGGLMLAGGPVADAVGLTAGFVLLPGLAAATRRAGVRNWRAQQLRGRARAAQRDVTCRCEGVVAWLGPEARHYVTHHLQEQPVAPPIPMPSRLLRCPDTGALFIDLPQRPAAVRVPDHVPEPADDEAREPAHAAA